VIQARKVPQAHKALLEQVAKALQEHKAQQGHREPQVWVSKAQPEQVAKVQQVQAFKVQLALRVFKVDLDCPDHKEQLVPKVLMAPPVLKVFKVG
jgi:hypothetical protein